MLTEPELRQVLAALRRARELEFGRLSLIRRYMLNEACDIYVPAEANDEYKMLVDQARFNVMPLVVTAVAQNLYVDGYRPTGPSGRAPTSDNSPIWDKVWQANRMDARQSGIYRSAVTYGSSYATVLPAVFPGPDGQPQRTAKITPWSPLRLTALYEDPINDPWPRFAMTVDQPDVLTGRRQDPAISAIVGPVTVRVYDETHVYTVLVDFPASVDGSVRGILRRAVQGPEPTTQFVDAREHGLGVTPVVRYLDQTDLDGASLGKVEPLLPAQRQLNQTTFSLLMTQQYSAFRQRWATGMVIEEDENGNPKEPFNSAVSSLWQAESTDTNFGEFGESKLAGYLDSRDKNLIYIASTAQIPPHNLLVGSGISNISAETLAAIEAGHRRDIDEHQTSFGESTEQLLRLAGRACGDETTWNDTSAQVVWRDTTTRSLGQVIDALVKMASGLGIPVQALWERIPGVTDQDIARWIEMANQADLMGEIRDMFEPESTPSADDEAGEVKSQADAMGVLIRSGVDADSAAATVGLDGLEFTGAVPVSLRLPEEDAAALESE